MDPAVSVATLEQKQGIFGRTIGLAGALAFLHDELFIASTSEQLCCYHLDLKPHNILVFEEEGKVIWKVSDFGISQIKRIPISQANAESEHPTSTSFLNRIFRPDRSGAESSSGVKNPRDAGTYTAPEARHKLEKVNRASDVWSLGCVLTLVLSFLENQRTGIRDFEDARMKNRDDDLFYDSQSGTEPRPSARPAVLGWLFHLMENAKKRSRAEGEVFRLTSDLIRNRMLLPNPKDRIRAKKVEQELKFINSHFAFTPAPCQNSNRQQQPIIERTHSSSTYLSRFKNLISNHRSLSVDTSPTWHFKLPKSTRGCKFSYDGRHLGIESSETITTMSITNIQQKSAGTDHKALQPERWLDISLGSQYLCAAVKSPYFKV